ncbi:MAG: hypothetical protein PWQ48_1706 [Thermotogaceae bacterium]|jgi:peptide/nickel transport system ATP-binding protein|nr:hypothetical protein [Thermotogaceae bacterium]
MSSMNGSKLVVNGVTKIFKMGSGFSRINITAVKDISLEIDLAKGEIFTLAGESGSGKTTLSRIILGIIEPTYGKVLYRNKNIFAMKRNERRQFIKEVQVVSQNPFEAFNPLKKVESYLFKTAIRFGLARDKKGAIPHVEKALKAVGLSLAEINDRYPNELSGGQLQRVAIARSLITQPSMIVADEPVSMIDASLRMSIINLIKQLNEESKINFIYITHDLATAYYVSHKIAIMLKGEVVELGSIDLLTEPLHPYTELLRTSIPEPDPDKALEAIDKELVISKRNFDSDFACKFADRCPSKMKICEREEPKNYIVNGRIVKCHMYSNKGIKMTNSIQI